MEVKDLEQKITELTERNNIQKDIIDGKYKKLSDNSKDIFIAELKKDIERLKMELRLVRNDSCFFSRLSKWIHMLDDKLDDHVFFVEPKIKQIKKDISKIMLAVSGPVFQKKRVRLLGPACEKMAIKYRSFSA